MPNTMSTTALEGPNRRAKDLSLEWATRLCSKGCHRKRPTIRIIKRAFLKQHWAQKLKLIRSSTSLVSWQEVTWLQTETSCLQHGSSRRTIMQTFVRNSKA
uniref:Uncharacterized protein n=1 Tax=Cacopsylla melanoneura TaxID=428564 RepID=A0A8D8T5I3_9HEMI